MNETEPRAGRPGRPRAAVLSILASTIAAAGLTACGSSPPNAGVAAATSASGMHAPSSSADTGMAATATTIMIEDFRCKTPATVAPGARVSVMNMDGEAHTVTADKAGGFAVTVPAGQTVTFTAPASPGSYAFQCDDHSDMHGTLVVQ